MAELTEEQKLFIVQQNARYKTPTEVSELVREEFDIEIHRRQAQAYDPTKFQGRQMARKWVDIFNATRKAFLENVGSIPIANQSVRVERLEALWRKQSGPRGNPAMAQSLLEQASKEVGGAFSNRREISGPDGKPIETKHTLDTSKLSDSALEELANLLP